MALDSLLDAMQPKSVLGPAVREVGSLRCDSRKVEAGDVFFALKGAALDGHEHIPQALEKGAAAIVAETPGDDHIRGEATWAHVRDSRKAMALAADTYFGHPSADVGVIGITGTNGKTTTAFLVHHLLKASWRRAGMMGTVAYDNGFESTVASNTTPESIEVQRLLAEMRDNGCRGAVMEVSSHGLVQHRTAAVDFRVGVFTNLTQDHLDYHGTFEEYFAAKRMLFEQIDAVGNRKSLLVVNGDDKYGKRLLESGEYSTTMVSYGQGLNCDFRINNVRTDFTGTQFQLEIRNQRSLLVRLPLIGRYNVMNATAALAAVQGLGLNLREAVRHLQDSPQVPGRLETVEPKKTAYRVYVDYAHTPDALSNALQTLRDLKPARIITVFGCGGDRDRMKRPLMAAAVDSGSDIAIITSDNPRTEDPAAIIREVAMGMKSDHYITIEDRRAAIYEAVRVAKPRDIILIAGKGHEDYQEINGKRIDFDDRVAARHAINDRIVKEAEIRSEREERS